MPTMTIALADLEDELRDLPLRDQAALARATRRTLEVDAQRWIQWSLRGGGLAQARPKARPTKPKRRRFAKILRKLLKLVAYKRKGKVPKIPGPGKLGPKGDPCARKTAPAYRKPIDTGDYANSWRSEILPDGTGLFYSASSPPEKAGVIEHGRRPGWIPIGPLAEWVKRKLGCKDPRKARSIAYAISRYASKNARPGLKVLERAHPKIAEALARNTEAELRRTVSQAAMARAIKRT